MDKSFYLKKAKGQADTVFEVLIAVILLGFVLVAATFAMSSLSNTKCSKSIDISLQDLSRSLEKASTNILLTTDFVFKLSYCFGSDANVTLERYASSVICTTYCPGSNGTCYLLKYYNQKDKVNPVRYKCVDISPSIEINGSCSDTPEGYDVLQGENSSFRFPNGRYKFTSRNFNATTSSSPVLCIYKKQKGVRD